MVLVAGVIALPLIIYLISNPGVEVRLDELSQPLTAAAQGDIAPLLENITSGLGTINFSGDGQWRYNIPGRPLLAPLMSVLFIFGVGIAGWRIYSGLSKRSPAVLAASAFFALAWLILGLIPVLITGKEFSTPRTVVIQPVIYLFPALSLGLLSKIRWPAIWISTTLALLLFTALFAQTIRQYFTIWADEPEVRVQYESSLVTILSYLDREGGKNIAISTTTPEKFHSPAVALMYARDEGANLRWFNGLHSLLVPAGPTSQIAFSGFASLNPFLDPYFQGSIGEEIPTDQSEVDRPLLVFTVNPGDLREMWAGLFSTSIISSIPEPNRIRFGDAAQLLGYDLQTTQVSPGGEVRLITLWQLGQPLEGAVLFTQVLGQDGLPIAQVDRLDAPGLYWKDGDFLLQLHQFRIPEEIESGDYPLIVGIYPASSSERLPVFIDGLPSGDHVTLPPLKVGD